MKKLLASLLLSAFGVFAGLFAYNAVAADIDNTPDCDTVAIIKCGAFTPGALRNDYDANAYGDLQKVYGAFGISRSDLNGSFVDGVVWRDGRVTVDGHVVATNARTAGRWYNPTSDMNYISGTDRAYKMSTSHFANAGQTAMLKFNSEGKFLFAVIKSCSNPVVANPVVPKFTCDSLTKEKITRNKFEFTAKASHNQLADVREYEFAFGDGSDHKVVKTSAEKTTVAHVYANPGTYTVRVKVTFKVLSNGELKTVSSEDCVKTVTVLPEPVFTCDNLSASVISRNEREFTAKTTARNGAEVVKYVFRFGDGSDPATVNTASTTTSVRHTYAQAGTYNTMVTVTFLVNGEEKVVVSDTCKTTVTIDDTPVYTCDGVTKSVISRTEREFAATATAINGATLTGFRYDFGDGATATDVDGVIRHNYVNAGDYTVSATALFMVNGEVKEATGPQCQTVVTIVPPETHPGVKIDKKVNGKELDEVAVGETFTYQVRVTNTGDVALKDVFVSDPAPAHVAISNPSAGNVTNNVWSYTIPSLAVGQSMDFTLEGKVTKYVEGRIVNTACVDAPQVNPGTPGSDDCDDATVTVPTPKVPHVSIDKKVNGVENTTVAVGEVFTYQVRVTNDGQVALTNAVVSDPAPAGVTLLQASAGTVTNNTWSYTIPSLAVSESKDFTVTAKYVAYATGTQVNTACVNATEVNPTQPSVNDDCDDASTQVTPPSMIPVCDLTTGTIIVIKESDFDATTQTKDLEKCKDVVVCELATKKIVVIKEYQFDSSKYSRDLADCKETPVVPPVTPPVTPPTPRVLPAAIVATGPEALLSGLFGSSALGYGAYSFASSRRTLKNKLNK